MLYRFRQATIKTTTTAIPLPFATSSLLHHRCLINCEKMASASTRISIVTTCEGLACQTATYSWQLVIVNSIGHELPGNILTRNMTETDMDLPGIIIKANQLPPLINSEWIYRLKVWVSQDHGPAGNAAYQFRVNAPPIPGNCTVTPKSGQALKTAFSILCTGWQVRNKISCS